MRVTAATRVFALLGDPVAHSLSPTLQNAALQADARDAVYVALRCERTHVAALMRTLAAAGGGGNVTVPHKIEAAAALDVVSRSVERTGACNTFWGHDGALYGDNTDVTGFAAAARALVGRLAGVRALVLGSGGAAAAALCALLDAGAAFVEIRSRSRERATALCRRFHGAGDAGDAARCASGAAEDHSAAGFDLIVNATPLGLRADDALPLPPARGMPPLLDLVYRAGGTRWITEARALGIVAADGRGMLLEQGAAAYARWFGAPAPLAAMRAALDAALGGTREDARGGAVEDALGGAADDALGGER